MTQESRHFVWITMDENLFSIRYGFGEGSIFGSYLHGFIISILDDCKLGDEKYSWSKDYRPVQVGTYSESNSGDTRYYHVSEEIAKAFYGLNGKLRGIVEGFAAEKEAVGKNILLQMIKSDVIGEALK